MRLPPRAKRATAVGTTIVVAAIALSACSSSSTGAETCDGVSVEVGITNSLSDSVLYIAQDKGHFADEGLDVTLRPFKAAGEMIPYLAAGHLAVGAGAPSAGFYNGIARDIDIKIVADKSKLSTNFDYMPFLVRKDLVDSGEVTSVADLAGYKVAEPAPGTASASTVGAVLNAAGLEYSEVEHVYIGFPDHVTALQNGSIDASVTVEPAASKALASGEVVKLADSTESYNDQQLATLLYSGDFAKKEPAAAQCFMNAYVSAAEDYAAATVGGTWDGEGADEIVDIIADNISGTPELVRSTVPNAIAEDASVNVDSLKRDYQFFVDEGYYQGTKDIDFDELVDTSFAEKAADSAAEGK